MPTFNSFAEYVQSHIREYFPPEQKADMNISLEKVLKGNGQQKVALLISTGEDPTQMVFYLEDLYQYFIHGMDVQTILRSIAAQYQYADRPQLDVSRITDFSYMKDKIGYRIMNAEMNGKLLEDHLWEPVCNLAKAYQLMHTDQTGSVRTLLPKHILKVWDISGEELDAIAAANMKKKYPPALYSLDEMLLGEDGPVNLMGEKDPGFRMGLFCLTDVNGVAGASVALYPGVLEQVQRVLGDDLVVIPSSVEEVLILPKSFAMPDRFLGNMVREVNRTMDRKLVLSDRAYAFTKEKPYLHEIPGSLVRRWERRKDER